MSNFLIQIVKNLYNFAIVFGVLGPSLVKILDLYPMHKDLFLFCLCFLGDLWEQN
jgi:hypothetical protein